MPTIAKIWRAGCIIRSQFLDDITSAFARGTRRRQPGGDASLRGHAEGDRWRAAPHGLGRRAEWPAGAGAGVGARLFRQLPPRPRHGRTSFRRSATSSARTASTASTASTSITAPGAAGWRISHDRPFVLPLTGEGSYRCSTTVGTDRLCNVSGPLPSIAPSTERASSWPASLTSLVDDVKHPAGTGAAALDDCFETMSMSLADGEPASSIAATSAKVAWPPARDDAVGPVVARASVAGVRRGSARSYDRSWPLRNGTSVRPHPANASKKPFAHVVMEGEVRRRREQRDPPPSELRELAAPPRRAKA